MTGILIGIGTFAIIGILHPIVIKTEYYFGTKCWFVYLITGIMSICLSFTISNILVSALLSVLGFSLLWSIQELFEQKKRVSKGWFPENPNRQKRE